MPFSPTTNADGSPSCCAILEQYTMVACAYWNTPAQANSLLALLGGGNVTLFNFQQVSFPPSIVVSVSGLTVSIALSGTVNAIQAFGDVIGAFAVPYPGFTCLAHTFFFSVWRAIRAEIVAALPANVNLCNVIFCGHSFGASVALFGALDFAQNHIGLTVDFLGLAMPKPLTIGYNGPLPRSLNHVCSVLDPIPYLPPSQVTSMIPLVAPPLAIGIPVFWTHLATGWLVDGNDTPTQKPESYWSSIPSPSVISTFFPGHTAPFTGQWAIACAQKAGCGSTSHLVANLLETIIYETSPQNQNPPLAPFANVDYSYQNTQVFSSSPLVPLTPENVATVNNLVGSFAVVTNANPILHTLRGGNGMPDTKMTFFYKDNFGGFSESFRYGGLTPSAVPLLTLQRWVNLRLNVSGVNTTFLYVRLSQINSPRLVQIYYPADLGLATAFTGTAGSSTNHAPLYASDVPSVCLLIRRFTLQYYSLWFMRGLPDAIATNGGQYVPDDAGNFKNDLQTFFNFLLGLNTLGYTGNLPPPVTALITAVAVNPLDGTALLTMAGAPFVAAPVPPGPWNYRLQIRIRRVNQPKGMNGVYTVTVNSANTCTTLNQFNFATFVPNVGQIVVNTPQLIIPTKYIVEKIAERKTGRPFGVPPGRARSKLIR